MSTHSPILMAYPNCYIYLLGERGIKKITFTETEHFQITQAFLNRHERMVQILLEDDQPELPLEGQASQTQNTPSGRMQRRRSTS